MSGFRPFYLQFKRPSAYTFMSSSKIIKERKSLGLAMSERILFFGLREKRKQQMDYQHNILLKLRQRLKKRNIGDATYVCPLFLESSNYRRSIQLAALNGCNLLRLRPWKFEDILIYDKSCAPFLDHKVPILSEHICIPPHLRVTNPKHNYSFTEDGMDICFHSPKPLKDKTERLNKWIFKMIMQKEHPVTRDNAMEELKHLLKGDEKQPLSYPHNLFESDSGILSWLQWGDYLKEEYSIDQFAITYWR